MCIFCSLLFGRLLHRLTRHSNTFLRTDTKVEMSMSSCLKGYGVELRYPENWYKNNPWCKHGPMLLFERFVKGKSGKRFFACSACRNRKDCNAFVYEDEFLRKKEYITSDGKKITRELPVTKDENILQQFVIDPTYEEVLKCPETERFFCITCQKLIIWKQSEMNRHSCMTHNLQAGISKEDVMYASRRLYAPLECNSKNAQYFLMENCTVLILNTLRNLGFSKILCIGMPTLHENIQALKKSNDQYNLDSLLLDIDSRFAQSSPVGTFCHFNMFNHYIFDDSFMYLRKFLSSADQSQFAIVLDPPFGGMVDAIAETLKWLSQLHMDASGLSTMIGQSGFNILWIFPYFMERKINSVYEELKMLDYQVHYDNHRKFKKKDSSKRISPVRIFTNIALDKFVLPSSEGYRFCKICQRYVCAKNRHCAKCDSCTSKDGKTYVHCDTCAACFKPGWVHCKICSRCQPRSHHCRAPNDLGCHCCGKLTHKRRNCPIATSSYDSNDSTALTPTKLCTNIVFHALSSHTKRRRTVVGL